MLTPDRRAERRTGKNSSTSSFGECLLILPGTTCDDAMHVIEEIRISVSTIGLHFRGTPVSITDSCGVTALLAGDSAGGAFDRADKALYQAKEGGRNRCISL